MLRSNKATVGCIETRKPDISFNFIFMFLPVPLRVHPDWFACPSRNPLGMIVQVILQTCRGWKIRIGLLQRNFYGVKRMMFVDA